MKCIAWMKLTTLENNWCCLLTSVSDEGGGGVTCWWPSYLSYLRQKSHGGQLFFLVAGWWLCVWRWTIAFGSLISTFHKPGGCRCQMFIHDDIGISLSVSPSLCVCVPSRGRKVRNATWRLQLIRTQMRVYDDYRPETPYDPGFPSIDICNTH